MRRATPENEREETIHDRAFEHGFNLAIDTVIREGYGSFLSPGHAAALVKEMQREKESWLHHFRSS